MDSLPSLPSLPWMLVFALAAAWLLSLVAWWRAIRRPSQRQRRRMKTARQAETDAERLIEAAGYDIVDRQLTHRWDLEVDRQPRQVISRADLLLEREGRFFVADVKTGRKAPDPGQPATRRQLLEYLLAFEADGALVVDMEARTLHEVSFPGLLGWHDREELS